MEADRAAAAAGSAQAQGRATAGTTPPRRVSSARASASWACIGSGPRASKRTGRWSSTSKSSTIGSGCTRPWGIFPRPHSRPLTGLMQPNKGSTLSGTDQEPLTPTRCTLRLRFDTALSRPTSEKAPEKRPPLPCSRLPHLLQWGLDLRSEHPDGITGEDTRSHIPRPGRISAHHALIARMDEKDIKAAVMFGSQCARTAGDRKVREIVQKNILSLAVADGGGWSWTS